ncbi:MULTISPECIES: YgiQ family radical SAM protein [unclassified Janthinobacterium]|uniref:YgiQ family radical SAM protein n=1 Tax=unclassified Janthinobacterium TaxID=2610881 RepID=UPI0025B3030D|nr:MULTISPECIES: YgiQ family radical SAM protein [unclassified Janthinobacterium]MDN2674703.1 YgiQ family radical SAM protein [Janthinobacterium sp. SUN026]MDN2680598.1 YgiQ family radical SAM protein [Janthinobacterium sp. SUN033]MDN2705978.1 YgiQ family radical SAM protein [Janthinobacterium sp. SUN100]MDN2718717.1 YgiQ family radical SAM protein [Janthinobacterium sp. SUN120]MDO8069769.1 YgiQ family radical SAM protein [Janthinobacterium sp. SUN206]
MSRAEMDTLGWDQCDVILVTGDAYIDHPSFGMALVGRLLEAQGYRVGIISQPDWLSADAFRILGKPRLYYGITAGNMDSMVNQYTADRKIRSDDAYTANAEPNKRPDRAVTVYAQRAREAYPDVPIVIGSIEASLRRIAHYDYWSDKVRRSVLPDSKADLLIFGNAERALVDLTHRLAAGESIKDIRDLRGTAFMVPSGWLPGDDWGVHNSTRVDVPGKIDPHYSPYEMVQEDKTACATENASKSAEVIKPIRIMSREERLAMAKEKHDKTVVRLPAYDVVKDDPVMYAHASRVFHLESNPGNARAMVQAHGERDVWLNPPPLPLAMDEMDGVYDMNYARAPHPSYGKAHIPAWEMIRFSVNIMRGCFGGCTFCSITEHEGRIIQSRSEPSILREIEHIRDKTKGFTGTISDMGGPTANMYRLACKEKEIEVSCRRLSCVYPSICVNLGTDHSKLISLYRKARAIPGIKKVLISSGLRYDLAVRSPEYVKELVTHHVGGLLKIAPEHTEEGTLSKMMKPGIGAYDEFKEMFDRFSLEAGKKQYLIPYFIAAHPGTTDVDMLNLALWLKKNNFKLDQVQTFMPTPMAMATTMYHTRKNPLRKVTADSEVVETARSGKIRRTHKAFLRYQDPANWPILREALVNMGRGDLIGNGDKHLIPAWTSSESGGLAAGERSRQTHGAGTPDKFKVTPGKNRIALGGTAAAPKATAVESKVRPSILSTIKTKAKPAAVPMGRGSKPPAKGGHAAPARGGRK